MLVVYHVPHLACFSVRFFRTALPSNHVQKKRTEKQARWGMWYTTYVVKMVIVMQRSSDVFHGITIGKENREDLY